MRTVDQGGTLCETIAVDDRGVCFRPCCRQSIGCVSDVAQHGLVFDVDVMVNIAAVDAFSAHELHAAAVPLYRHEIEIITLICGKLSMIWLLAVWSEVRMEDRHCG